MTITVQATSRIAAIERPRPAWSPCAARPKLVLPAVREGCDEVTGPTIFVVDDDEENREVLTDILEEGGCTVHSFAGGARLLQDFHPGDANCLVIDSQLLGMSGIEIVSRMKSIDSALPAILLAGNATLEASVQAMRAGAVDFIQKPFESKTVYESIETALSNARRRQPHAVRSATRSSPDFHFTKRQHEILELVLDGQPSKIIAADLGISRRTVENHRAAIMKKTGSRSIPQLVRTTQSWAPTV